MWSSGCFLCRNRAWKQLLDAEFKLRTGVDVEGLTLGPRTKEFAFIGAKYRKHRQYAQVPR